MRVFIAVPVFNRKKIANICIPNLVETSQGAYIKIYDDGSKEDMQEIGKMANEYVRGEKTIGIEAQRIAHIKDYVENYSNDFDCFYFTDPDAFHDPQWMEVGERLIKQYNCITGLYNTWHHYAWQTKSFKDYAIRDFCPGISMLLTREMMFKVFDNIDSVNAFDFNIPDILGNQCVISKTSYVDHYGVGGIHNNDLFRDKAVNPTDFLFENRLKNWEILK